jgi:hypothetical protein
MVQPINYLQNVQDPFKQAVQGLQLGTGISDIYAQREEADQKRIQNALAQVEQQRYQTGINTYFATPSAERKYEDLERLFMGANKQQFDALQAVGKTMTDEKLASAKRFTGQVLSALESNPETAKQLLTQRAEAETDPMQKKAWQDTLKLAEVSPEQAIKSVELIGGASFGKDWYEGVSNVRKSRREEALAPAALIEANAKADKGVADAITAQATATNSREKAIADKNLVIAQAAKAAVEAQFAPQIALADLKAKAATLGLTKEQTNQALAATSKLSQETKKLVLEVAALEATGGIDPAKKFEQEEKLRKEFENRTKVYRELGSTYSNIESSSKAKTGPGDIALITGFMKMLDPGSVVRETEFATARDTAGLFDRLANQAQKLTSGQLFTLDSKQRQEYVNLAKQYLDSAQAKAIDDKKALGIVVKNYKLNPENVFGQEAPPLPTSATVGGQTYTRPPGFTDTQWRDYLKAQGVMQ